MRGKSVKIPAMRKLLVVCMVAACGSSNPKSTDASTADGPADSAAGDAPAARSGGVQIVQGFNGASNAAQASAGFGIGTSLFGPSIGTDGPCTAYNGAGAAMATLDAGAITVSGTLSPITLSVSGTPAKYQTAAQVPDPVFSAGATITIAGAGGPDIPAFNGTLTAPADVAGFTPPSSLSRAGYTATWTAGSGPGMWVMVVGTDQSTSTTLVICRVPDNGSFAIPASTFALLPPAENTGGVNVARVAETDVDVTNARVSLIAVSQYSSTIIPITQ